ncbi:hypothetical protein [Labrys neptuniae]
MTIRPLRMLAIALPLCAMLPASAALAGWRDGPFYGEGMWGGDFGPPARVYRPHRPMPFYGEDDWGYEGRGFYPRSYGPDDEGAYDILPDERRPSMRAPRPPRRTVRLPQNLQRPPLPQPRSATLGGPRKIEPAKPLPPVEAAKPRPEPVQEARALPVPRPNLESMDFEPAK